MACTSLVQLKFSFPAMLLPVAVPEERQFLPRNSDTRNHIQMEAARSSFESRCQPRGLGQDCNGGVILLLLRETTHYASLKQRQ
jgi:hypothetical protein